MAALVLQPGRPFDPAAFYAFTAERLPPYAQPLFVRLSAEADVTSTFKLRKVELQAEGYDPTRVGDPLFVRDDAHARYVPLTPERHAELATLLGIGAHTGGTPHVMSATTRGMSRLAAFGCLGVWLALAAIVRADDAAAPLHAVAPSFDAGKVEAGTPVEHTYVLRNDGPKTLQILAKPGCGCTTTSYDREIPPGGTGKVTARLDTTDLRGRVEKTIDIISNDPSRTRAHPDAHRRQPARLDRRAERPAPLARTDPPREPRGRDRTGAGRRRLPHHPRRGRGRAPGEGRGARRRGQGRAPTLSGHPDPRGESRRRLPQAERDPRDLAPEGAALRAAADDRRRRTARHDAPAAARRTAASRPSPSASPPATAPRSRCCARECSDRDFTATIAAVADEAAWDVTVRYTGTPGRRRPVNGVLRIFTDTPSQPLVIVRLAGRL